LRQSIKKNITLPANISTTIAEVRENIRFLDEMLNNNNRDESIVQPIVTSIKQKQEEISTLINQNIENETATTALLQAFEEIERSLAKIMTASQTNDEDSGESSGSADSVTNTEIGSYATTDNTFFKLHVEPYKQEGNDFFIQDAVKSNNPFLDVGIGNTTNTQPNPQFGTFLNTSNNSNNLFQNTPPPQNITFDFSTPKTTPVVQNTNNFVNPTTPPQNNNTGLFTLNNNYSTSSSPFQTNTNTTNTNGNTNGYGMDLFGVKTTGNVNSNPNPNLPMDLFGTSKTTVPVTNGNDPFASLFTMAVGTNGATNQTHTVQVTTNPPPKYNNPFL